MIQFVQTGEYRTQSVTIKRFVNGVEVAGDGFPIVESILQAFGSQPSVSIEALMAMTSGDYTYRVNQFKTYLTGKYSFLTSGDFVNTPSGTDNTLCVPGLTNSSGSIPITNQTEIAIFFDSSGSMNSTLTPLLEMRNTLLKNALLPFYNGDSVLYDSKVRVISEHNERTFFMLNNRGVAITAPTLIMVFQDEANPIYHTSVDISPRTTQFNTDMTNLRSTLSSLSPNQYRGMIFQVTRAAGEGPQFKSLIQNVQSGSANYPSGFNLSDKTEIGYTYDVVNGQTAQYYMDLITLKMRELGYRI